MSHEHFRSCIDACVTSALECEHCAEACLHESDVSAMSECIRLDMDCAQICWMAASYMSGGSRFAHELCALCADVCEACADECRRHEKHEHCRRCAEACRRCVDECRAMAGATA